MKRVLSAVLALSACLLTACASMSTSQNPDRSYLLIPIERESIQTDTMFIYYAFHGSSFADGKEFTIKVDPKNNFKQMNTLTPGIYRCLSGDMIYYRTDKVAKKFNVSINFSLKKDTVTIFPKKVVVYSTGGGKNTLQYIRFDNITEEDYQKYETYIKKQKAYEQLEIAR